MKYLKIIGVFFLAMVTLSAVAVASASALPNFAPAKFPETFLGSTGTVKLGGAATITCEKSMITGQILTSMAALALIDLNGKCEEPVNKIPCGGPTEGNFSSKKILSEPLLALLGYTTSGEVAKSLVGILVGPGPVNLTVHYRFSCREGLISVRGVVTGCLTIHISQSSTNVMIKIINFDASVSAGKQAITSFQLLSGTSQFMTNIGLGASLAEASLEPETEEMAGDLETQSAGEIQT